MAKKKTATKQAPAKKAASTKAAPPKKPAAKAASAKKSAAKKTTATATALPLDEQQIGFVAGQVWQTLHDKPPQTLAAIKKAVGGQGDAAVAAVGWLAREGKLEFATSGRTTKISLR